MTEQHGYAIGIWAGVVLCTLGTIATGQFDRFIAVVLGLCAVFGLAVWKSAPRRV